MASISNLIVAICALLCVAITDGKDSRTLPPSTAIDAINNDVVRGIKQWRPKSPHSQDSLLFSSETVSSSRYLTDEHSIYSASQACRPRHIHLSVGRHQNATHSSMIISFSFPPKCKSIHMNSCPQCAVNSLGAVRIGQDPNNLSTLVLGRGDDAMSYNASLTENQMKKARVGDKYFSDTYYHIEINDLKPGTRYYYKCLLGKETPSNLSNPDDKDRSGASEERMAENAEYDGDERHLNRQHLRRTQSQSHNSSPTNYLLGFKIISQSNATTFLTPPAPGEWYPPPLDRTIKFAVLGDLAAREHSRETVSKLEHNRLERKVDHDKGSILSQEESHLHHGQGIDCILLAGDIAYSTGDHSVWDDWMDMMSDFDFFKTIPLQIALGNHDLDYDPSTLEFGLAYEHRFRMPQVQTAMRNLASHELFHHKELKQATDFMPYEYGNAYYSFTFGPSKHIVLSSYSSFLPGSTQYQWLLSELESVDRSITPWLIVMLHCPVYTSFKTHTNEIFISEARVHLEPIFLKYVVNFVIAGHIHSYMRSVPMANFAPHPRGPIYIIQGNGGRNANEPYMDDTQEDWVKVRDHSMYGYGTLELFNTTHAKWDWVKTGFNAEEEEGKIRYEPDFALHDNVWVKNQWFSVEDEYLVDEEETN